jgi:uncharacterized lipoprotein YddW (UPF0748 family)
VFLPPLLTFLSCRTSPKQSPPPQLPREFRAAWVATVGNIDWPSKPGLPAAQQQREILAILDRAHALHLNAIILQVRTSCDALYPSPYEPWSYYLTGQQGKPPDDGYDPLSMWIAEAHRRGIELHAWFNPFRAKPADAKYALAPSHVARRSPDWVKSYGGFLWLDPGEPAAQDYTLAVMMDVVRRYDVDGIHIDDYFYPYPVNDPATGKSTDFPDETSWKRYQMTGRQGSAPQTRADWRRENINRLVRRIYQETKQLKPWVKVGISPFGIWKPGYPPVVKGFNQYEQLYADAKLWLNEGWCDYFTPQLYWKTTAPSQPYEVLLKWWIGENHKGRNVWPGLFTSRIPRPTTASAKISATTRPATTALSDRIWSPQDIVDQIEVTRRTPGASGHVHFSMITLSEDRQQVDEVLERLYAEPALVPASPWLSAGAKRPAPPRCTASPFEQGLHLRWEGDAWLWAVQVKYASGAWRTELLPAGSKTTYVATDRAMGAPVTACISAVDRLGNQSVPVIATIVSR